MLIEREITIPIRKEPLMLTSSLGRRRRRRQQEQPVTLTAHLPGTTNDEPTKMGHGRDDEVMMDTTDEKR